MRERADTTEVHHLLAGVDCDPATDSDGEEEIWKD
jgi:hypothetical protein